MIIYIAYADENNELESTAIEWKRTAPINNERGARKKMKLIKEDAKGNGTKPGKY